MAAKIAEAQELGLEEYTKKWMEGKEANDTEAPSTADIADTAVPVPASAHEVPAVVTMPAQSSSATGSADGAAPPPSAPSTADIPAPVSSVTPEGANKDITQQFAPGSETANPKQITVKDQFLAADLIVPAITLKKTKQALSSAEAERTAEFLGVLGESSITSYRVEKKGVQRMVLADYGKYSEMFWAKASSHLQDAKIAALILPSNSDICLESVSCRTVSSAVVFCFCTNLVSRQVVGCFFGECDLNKRMGRLRCS